MSSRTNNAQSAQVALLSPLYHAFAGEWSTRQKRATGALPFVLLVTALRLPGLHGERLSYVLASKCLLPSSKHP
jgi:hypothetical protein